MVNSPVKRAAVARSVSHAIRLNDTEWIHSGLDRLLKTAEWVSPISKTAYARTHTAKGTTKAATMHLFNPSDVATARQAAGVKRKLQRERDADQESERVEQLQAEVAELKAKLQRECQAKGERVQQLRKELAESEHQRTSMARHCSDQLKTRMRENHRLKEDLRIMVERATEIRDERDVADRLAENLQAQLDLVTKENEKMLQRERELSMELVAGLNKKNKELSVQKAVVASLSAKCQELEDKNDALEEDLEKYSQALEQMMAEAQTALILFGNNFRDTNE